MSSHEKLIPDDLRKALPGLYSTEHDQDPLVRAKLLTPWSSWTWYVTEFDGDDLLFGLVDGHEVELGYFTLSELEALRGPGDLRVERDRHFTPRPLSQVRQSVARRRGEPGCSEAPEQELDPKTEASAPDAFRAATDPFVRPAVTLIETRLSSAWAASVSGTIASPGQAATIMQRLIGESDREHFVALYLNARHQIKHAHIVSRGTAQNAPVHPREVFKAAVLANATAVVVGHNHPSGDVQPSQDDAALAERLTTAGDVLGIQVLDALVVGPGRRFHSTSLGRISFLEGMGSHDVRANRAAGELLRLAETARFLLSGTAGDLFEESAEELALQVLDLAESMRNQAATSFGNDGLHDELQRACEGLLQDIAEVLERQGEAWWDETVTSGTHHRVQAERLTGQLPYGPKPEASRAPPEL